MKSNQKSVTISIPPLLQLKWSLEQLSSKLLSHSLSDRSTHKLESRRIPRMNQRKSNTCHVIAKRKFTSYPNDNAVKRIKLVLKSDSDSPDSTPAFPNRDGTTLGIQKLKLKCTPKSKAIKTTTDKSSAKLNAHEMVKWAMKNNVFLSQHYQVTGILGIFLLYFNLSFI